MHEKATTGESVLTASAPGLSVTAAEALALGVFDISGRASPLVSERDQNFRLQCDDERQYVLKIANPAEERSVLDFQNGALLHAAACAPNLSLPRVLNVVGSDSTIHELQTETASYYVRMLSFIEGEPLAGRSSTPTLRRAMGNTLAQLDRALWGYFHPAARHELLWDVNRCSALRPLLASVTDTTHRELLERLLNRFEAVAQPQIPLLRAQVIHNDMNPANVVTQRGNPDAVAGLIDFGDMVHAPLINDLAVAIAYQLMGQSDPLGAACDVIVGYHELLPISDAELEILPELVIARLLTSATVSEWRAAEHPENRDYILTDMSETWSAIEALAAANTVDVVNRFRRACGLPATPGRVRGDRRGDDEQLRRRRSQYLTDSLSLFYDRPLHIVRGEGVWLHDADGRQYLDCYNNVAHVGHSHPAVTAEIAAQTRRLNTNTRYLHENIVDYAERLTASLPKELSVCYFVCTGSEANDLALQIARAASGAKGAIVAEHAYHGNTTVVAQLSPEDTPAARRSSWVEIVQAPYLYGGTHRDNEPDAVDNYVGDVDRAIVELGERGHACAAIFFDSIFSSNGIFLPPRGYLQSVYRRVRSAGGLCVADEVQSGFGRTGGQRWGFEVDGVVPDIVTLGKPMGNGHPLAAVVTTPDIAAEFSKDHNYFNTYGGNPVSCAAGLAVLRVIEREKLQENARTCGDYLRSLLTRLQSSHSLIGDIRGAGLFTGIELVLDRDSREPAPLHAQAVVNGMRDNGVLIGRTGIRENVLKLRPPLVFNKTHADQLVDALDRVLAGNAVPGPAPK